MIKWYEHIGDFSVKALSECPLPKLKERQRSGFTLEQLAFLHPLAHFSGELFVVSAGFDLPSAGLLLIP